MMNYVPFLNCIEDIKWESKLGIVIAMANKHDANTLTRFMISTVTTNHNTKLFFFIARFNFAPMKIFLLILLFPIIAFGQNRIATKRDISLYGRYITVGDLILDRPTKLMPDGIHKLVYTRISKAFPTLRENAVIWVDGNKLGRYCEFRLLNGKETTPWHISNATIKPIPGTGMKGVYTDNSYGGFLHLIQGLKNVRIDGGDDAKYPGLNSFPRNRVFLKGSFGISATSIGIYKSFHVFSISVLDGGSIYLSGLEGEHGFSVLRLQGGSYDWTVSITIENCYLHDTASEGAYIGFTHALPGAKIKDLTMKNIICARTGSEALQMQHLVGKAHVSNATLFASDAGYLRQFMPGQDTGIQLSSDQGENVIENVVVDSWGSHGLNLFGSDAFPAGKNSKTTVRNILFNDGRGPAIYLHPSCKHGMNWHFEDIYLRKPNNDYYKQNRAATPDYIICANEGTDIVSFDRVTHDGKLSNVFQDKANLTIGTVTQEELPQIAYVNSGFYEPASKIKVWHQFFGAYITGKSKVPTHWEVGDIAQDMQPGSLPVFCKCLVEHDATSVRPKDNPNFVILLWDEKGCRSDQPEWRKGDTQRPYPPDDLRVKENSYYANLNIGFVQDENQTNAEKNKKARLDRK